MAKKPTPKRRHPKFQGKQRHGAWVSKVSKRLSSLISNASCPKCGERIIPHRACQNCGTYNGREVIKAPEVMAPKTVKKVKA